jgi:hypothetical protein
MIKLNLQIFYHFILIPLKCTFQISKACEFDLLNVIKSSRNFLINQRQPLLPLIITLFKQVL